MGWPTGYPFDRQYLFIFLPVFFGVLLCYSPLFAVLFIHVFHKNFVLFWFLSPPSDIPKHREQRVTNENDRFTSITPHNYSVETVSQSQEAALGRFERLSTLVSIFLFVDTHQHKVVLSWEVVGESPDKTVYVVCSFVCCPVHATRVSLSNCSTTVSSSALASAVASPPPHGSPPF